MKALRPFLTAAAALLAVSGQFALGAPAQAAGVPAVRSLHVVSQIDHAAKIAWSAPDTSRVVVRYRVAWGDHVVRLSPAARSYVVSGLPNGDAETVAVRPVYRSGARGDRRTVQAMGAGRPATPAAPIVSTSDNPDGAGTLVTVSWGAVAPNGPGPVTYRVSRKDATGSHVACDWTTRTSCDDVIADGSGTATYQVRARNAEATSARAAGHSADYVSPSSAGTSVLAPAAPAISAAKGATVPPGSGCSSTCWYITAQAQSFAAAASCGAHTASTGALIGSTWTQSNGSFQTTNWVGSGIPFYISCSNGARSATTTW